MLDTPHGLATHEFGVAAIAPVATSVRAVAAACTAAAGAVGAPVHAVLAEQQPQICVQHIARHRRLTGAGDASDDNQPPDRQVHIGSFDVMQRDALQFQSRGALVHPSMRLRRMQQRLAQKPPGGRARIADEILHGAGSDNFAAAHTGRRPEIEHMIRAPDGVLIVLDDNEHVAASRQLGQRIEQNGIVPGMQADGRLIQHVTHPLQVRAELCGKAYALRLSARQRRRRAVQLQIAEAHTLQEPEACPDLRQQIARDLPLAGIELELREESGRGRDGLCRGGRDRLAAEAHVQRNGTQALPVARFAGLRLALVPVIPPDLLAALLGIEAGHLETGAVAALAPAVLRIEGEQARIELAEAAATRRTGALRREHRDPIGLRAEHVHQSLAEIERARERQLQRRVRVGTHFDLGDGQLDRMLLEA